MYPPARRGDASDVFHGVVVPDPYRWLEAGNDPEVKAWSLQQDNLARGELGGLPRRAEFLSRMKELIYEGDVWAPRRFSTHYFYQRRDKGKEKRVFYMRDVGDGGESVVIDPTQWPEAEGLSIQGLWPSPDGSKIAYTVSKNNTDRSTLRVWDVASHTDLAIDRMYPIVYSDPSWSADGKGFYYRLYPQDPNVPPDEQNAQATSRYHRLGDDPAHDRVVREPSGDSRIFDFLIASRDGRWLFLEEWHGYSRFDWFFRDLKKPNAPWTPISEGRDHRNDLIDYKGFFYMKTPDGAPRGRIVRIDPAHPGPEHWKELVAERSDATLDEFRIVGGKLLLQWNKDAATELEIRELDGTGVRPIELPALGEVASLEGQPEEDEAFVRFNSYAIPPVVYALSMKSGALRVWAKNDLPGVDPSRYLIDRIFYESKDGTRVPMFIARRRDVPLNGAAPVLLNAYGGFAISNPPRFNPGSYTWIEHGGIFAYAAIRGGGEYGEGWHRSGMLTQKQHTFDDLIAGAEELVRRGWARPERLAVSGRSNGGLTVAAVITQRPDLFRAAICTVPVIDVIRSPRIGNGKGWATEYGSPEDPEQLRAMLGYSPYHNIKPGTRYPSLLVLSADSDDRVDPLHARKFVAAMQAARGGRPVLLKIARSAGHHGADAVSLRAEDDADANAFLLNEMGIH